eukprot:3150715-Alexandrium_andersonii.AAC.1
MAIMMLHLPVMRFAASTVMVGRPRGCLLLRPVLALDIQTQLEQTVASQMNPRRGGGGVERSGHSND